MAREVTIAVVQQGPNSPDKDKNIEAVKKSIDEANKGEKADFIVFPELATTQFFAIGLGDEGYFKQAEKLPGPFTKAVGEKAKQYQSHILLGIFEKGEGEGEHYNSEVVIGPNGSIIKGTRDDGYVFPAARKNYLGSIKVGAKHTDEKLYFKPGPGHILFETKLAKIGIVICYDRWFAESYRCLSLMGAEIVFVPVASAGYVSELWLMGLRIHAAENELFVVGCNKAGLEKVQTEEARYYGMSSIIGTNGRVIEQAPEGEPAIIKAKIDLDEITEARQRIQIYRDLRPEIYGIMTKPRQ